MSHTPTDGNQCPHPRSIRFEESVANLQKATGLSIADASTLVEATPSEILLLADHPLWTEDLGPSQDAEKELLQPPGTVPRALLGQGGEHTHRLLDSTRRRLAALAAEIRLYGPAAWRAKYTPAKGVLNIESHLRALDQLQAHRVKGEVPSNRSDADLGVTAQTVKGAAHSGPNAQAQRPRRLAR